MNGGLVWGLGWIAMSLAGEDEGQIESASVKKKSATTHTHTHTHTGNLRIECTQIVIRKWRSESHLSHSVHEAIVTFLVGFGTVIALQQ